MPTPQLFQTFRLNVIMDSNYCKISLILTLFIVAATPINSHAFLWGAKNYEECLSQEMKGRDINQESIVSEACRKKFPTLKSFINKNKYGTLICNRSGGHVFELGITKTNVNKYKIKSRTADSLIAEDAEYISENIKGLRFELSFLTGYGLLYQLNGTTPISNFQCEEAR